MKKVAGTLPLADPVEEALRDVYQKLRENMMHEYDQLSKVTRKRYWGEDYWLADKLKTKRAKKRAEKRNNNE